MLPGHLKIHIDTARDERPSQIRTNLKIGQSILNTLLLTDYQTFSGQTKYDLQSATQLLHNILQKHDLDRSIKKYNVMAFQGTYHT
jgi:Ser-tRNA(Ala) deacylase AlaX